MIKYLFFDVDGTLTDGKIYMSNTGEFMKAFNIKDGCGIRELLIPSGIIPVIISGRKSDIVSCRCQELGITEEYQGVNNKLEKMISIIGDKANLMSVAYMGDDINDISCMTAIKASGGVIGCPADAVNRVKRIADYVSIHNGGDGAARDFIEWIINTKTCFAC